MSIHAKVKLLSHTALAAMFTLGFAQAAQAQNANNVCANSPTGACSLDNGGTFNGDVEIIVPATNSDTVQISNSGTINGYGWVQADEGDGDGTSFNYANSGALTNSHASAFVQVFGSATRRFIIDSTIDIEAQHGQFTFRNVGSITEQTGPDFYVPYGDRALVALSNEANAHSTTNVTNTGIISTNIFGTSALAVGSLPETGGVAGVNPVVTINNSGTIASTGGAILYQNPEFNAAGQYTGTQSVIEVVAALAVGARGTGTTSQVNITNADTGVIAASGNLHLGLITVNQFTGPIVVPHPLGNLAIANAPANLATVAIATSADRVHIVNGGEIRGGAGTIIDPTNDIELHAGGGITLDGNTQPWTLLFPDLYLAGAIHTFGGATGGSTDFVQNTSTGSIQGSIDLGAGNDVIDNAGIIVGNVFLRGGDDEFRHAITGSLQGIVNGGAGFDRLVLVLTGGTFNPALLSQFVNFEDTIFSGQIQFSGNVTIPLQTFKIENGTFNLAAGSQFATLGPIAITGSGGADTVTIAGTVSGGIDLGDGDDVLTLSGSIAGDILTGAGSDVVTLNTGAVWGAALDGGEGVDRLAFHSLGSAATPFDVGGIARTNFEELQALSGYNIVTGPLALDRLLISQGQFFGQAGSTITAPNILVASGAIFGSAGTVVGNVQVGGTLAPGASPGTMTVNGNVVLSNGSNTQFEFTPTVSDQLIINGTLAIQNGASLTLSGVRPLSPGAYTLITATNGITGTFGTNVTRDSTVLGVLSYTPNSIQLLSTLQVAANTDAQTKLTVDYINDQLMAGTASSSLMAAFPQLLGGDGFANNAAIRRLSPEPYASAVQIGFENGLGISQGLRQSTAFGNPDKAGLLVFGQGFDHTRNFQDERRGVSGADIDSSGYFGGIGYGTPAFEFSAFVGKSDAKQRMTPLAARTDAKSTFFGGKAHLQTGGFSLGGSIIVDKADATTTRSPLSTATQGRYRLRGTTVDVYAGYQFHAGGGWTVTPSVGMTHITVKRGDVVESGGNGLSLSVDGQSYKATFWQADLRLSLPDARPIRPWMAIGIRHRSNGDSIAATGGFATNADGYTVFGVERDKSFVHVGAGLEAKLGSNIGVFVSGANEFGSDNGARHVNVGMNMRF